MEQSHSENTKRIAKNTLMLYGRMLFSMVVSLYTLRVRGGEVRFCKAIILYSKLVS